MKTKIAVIFVKRYPCDTDPYTETVYFDGENLFTETGFTIFYTGSATFGNLFNAVKKRYKNTKIFKVEKPKEGGV